MQEVKLRKEERIKSGEKLNCGFSVNAQPVICV